MLESGRRPVMFGGCFGAALEWSIARGWPSAPLFVLPPEVDPASFDLGFLRGVDVLALHRPAHSARHVRACMDALQSSGARLVVAVALPELRG